MIFEDLKVYEWKDFFDKPVSEGRIIKLLGNDLFRMSYSSSSYEFTCPSHSISKMIFMKNGTIKFFRENKRYQVSEGEFILIPRGRTVVTYSDMCKYLTAILIRDLPDEIVRKEREKFPEIRMPWKVKSHDPDTEND